MASLSTNIIINSTDRSRSGFNSASRRLRELERGTSATARSMKALQKSAETVRRALSVLAIGGVFVGVAASVIATADSMSLFRAKVALVIESDLERLEVEKKLIAVSKLTRSDLAANAALFNKVSLATKDYGSSTEQVLLFTEQLNKSLQISGATTVESASTILQLGQALASGRLQGEEFRAVNEASIHTTGLLAKELGVTRGELKALSSAGKITTEVMFNALINATRETNAEFAKIPLTVGAATKNLTTAYAEWVGDSDKASGATKNLAQGINTLANNFDHVVNIAGTFGTVLTSGAILAMIKMYEARRIDTIIAREQLAIRGQLNAQSLQQLSLDRILLQSGTRVRAQQIALLEAKIARSRNERIIALDTAKLTALTDKQKVALTQLNYVQQRHTRLLQETTLANRRNTTATKAANVATGLLGKSFAVMIAYDLAKVAAEWLHSFESVRVGALYVSEGIDLLKQNLDLLFSPTDWFLEYDKNVAQIGKTLDEFDQRRELTTDKSIAERKRIKELDSVIAEVFKSDTEEKISISERLTRTLSAQAKKLSLIKKKSVSLTSTDIGEFERHLSDSFEQSKDKVAQFIEELNFAKEILDGKGSSALETKFLVEKLGKLAVKIKVAKGQTKNFAREMKALDAVKLINIEEAYKVFGITSQGVLDKTAKSARNSFEVLKLGEPDISVLASAFGKVAIAEAKANQGIVSHALEQEAAIYGVQLALDEQGTLAIKSINIFHDKVDKLKDVSKEFKDQLALTNASSFDEFEASLTRNLQAVSDESDNLKENVEDLKDQLNSLDDPSTLEGSDLKKRIGKVEDRIDQADGKARQFKNTLEELNDIKLSGVEKAFRKLGLIAKSELQRIAKDSQEAFQIVVDSEEDIDKIAKAFTKVAQSSTDANDGIVSNAIKQQAVQNELILVVNKQGDIIAKTAEEFEIFNDVTLNSADYVSKLLQETGNADASDLGKTFVKTAETISGELGGIDEGVKSTVANVNQASIKPFETNVTESVIQTQREIVKLAKASTELTTAIDNVSSDSIFDLRDSYSELGITSKAVMAGNVADAKDAYENIANSGTASVREIELANERLKKVIGENSEEVLLVQKAFDDLGITSTKTLEDTALSAVKNYNILRDSGVASLAELEQASYKVVEATDALTESNDLLTGEYQTLGITSAKNLELLASKAQEAYESIRDSGMASAEEISQAFVASQDIQQNTLKVVTELSRAYEDLGITSTKVLIENSQRAQKAYDVLKESGTASLAELEKANNRVEEANKRIVDSTKLLTREYQLLGIKSTASLKEFAVEAEKAYEKIKNSGTASANDIQLAQRKMVEAQRASVEAVTDLSLAYDQLGIKSRKVLIQDALEATRSYQVLKASGTATLAELEKASYKVEEANKAIADSTKRLTGEYATLGLKSSELLEEQAFKAKQAYEKIRDSGTASQSDIQRALELSKSVAKDVYSEINLVARAYEKLGIESTKSLTNHEQQAIESYTIIKESGTASARDIQLAFDKVNDATRAVIENNDGLAKSFEQLGITSSKSIALTQEHARQSYSAIKESGVATAKDIQNAFTSMANSYLKDSDGIISKSLQLEASRVKVIIGITEEGKAQAINRSEYRKKVVDQLRGDLSTNNSMTQVRTTQRLLNAEIRKARDAYIANAIASGKMRNEVIEDAKAIERAQQDLVKSIISSEQAKLRSAEFANDRAAESAKLMQDLIAQYSGESSQSQIGDINEVSRVRSEANAKAIEESKEAAEAAKRAKKSIDGVLTAFNGVGVTNNVAEKLTRYAEASEADKLATAKKLSEIGSVKEVYAGNLLALRDQILQGVQRLSENQKLVEEDAAKQQKLREALVARKNITSQNVVESKSDGKAFVESLKRSTDFQRSRTVHDNNTAKVLDRTASEAYDNFQSVQKSRASITQVQAKSADNTKKFNAENLSQAQGLDRAAKIHSDRMTKFHTSQVISAKNRGEAIDEQNKEIQEISKTLADGNAASRASHLASLGSNQAKHDAENLSQAQGLDRAAKIHADRMSKFHAGQVVNAKLRGEAIDERNKEIQEISKTLADGNAASRASYLASLGSNQARHDAENLSQAQGLDRAAKIHADRMAKFHASQVVNAKNRAIAIDERYKEIETVSKFLADGNAASRASYLASLGTNQAKHDAENLSQAQGLDRAAKIHADRMAKFHASQVVNAKLRGEAIDERNKQIQVISKALDEGNAASRAKYQSELGADQAKHDAENKRQAEGLDRAAAKHRAEMSKIHTLRVKSAIAHNKAVEEWQKELEATSKLISEGNAQSRAKYLASQILVHKKRDDENARQARNLNRAAKIHADRMTKIHADKTKNAIAFGIAIDEKYKQLEAITKALEAGNAASRARFEAGQLLTKQKRNAENARQARNLNREDRIHADRMAKFHAAQAKNAIAFNIANEARHKELEAISKALDAGNAASRATFEAEKKKRIEDQRSRDAEKNKKFFADRDKDFKDAKDLNDKINKTLEGGTSESDRIANMLERFKKRKENDAKAKLEQESIEKARLIELDRQHDIFLKEKAREKEQLAEKRRQSGNSSKQDDVKITTNVVKKTRKELASKPHIVQTKRISLDLNLNGKTVPTTFIDNAETRAFINELEQSGKLI